MVFLFKLIFQLLLFKCLFESLACDIYLDTQELAINLKSLLISQKEGEKFCISLANDLNYQLSDGEVLLNQSSTIIRFFFFFHYYFNNIK